MNNKILTKNQLRRMPDYLSILKKYKGHGIKFVNCQEIADDLNLNQEQVRKDIAAVATTSGIPNKGRDINQLVMDIEQVLGYDDIHNAIIVGVGSLGRALINYQGFREYGLKIVGAFDDDEGKIGTSISGVRIYDIKRLKDSFQDFNAKIGIITVPKEYAQEIADMFCDCGVLAIWNFAPTHIVLKNPSVIISNTNMAASLAVLSHQLFLKKEQTKNKINDSFLEK